jgi:lipopolysaccharide export system protein LptA
MCQRVLFTPARFLAAALLLAPLVTSAEAQSGSPGSKRPDLFRTGQVTRKLPGEQRIKATPAPQRKRPKGPTEITANGSAQFDNAARLAVFVEDVVVVDPEFTLYGDRLTVYLKSKNDAATTDSRAPSASPAAGGIDHAIADAAPGSQVIILKDKLEADGSVTKCVARADRATFDAKTGDMVLTGNPSLQQGGSYTVAAEPGTVMTLNRNGDMINKGATRTILRELAATENRK